MAAGTKGNKKKYLKARKARALDQLIEGRPLGDIAKSVGISRKTLWSWRKDPEFRNTWETRERAIARSTQARLIEMSMTALDQLRDIIDGSNKGVTVSNRLTAIRMLLDRLPAAPVESIAADNTYSQNTLSDVEFEQILVELGVEA